MGDPDKADEDLIPFAVGYGDPEWNIKTADLRVDTNHRLEIANLVDLSHVNWVHPSTLGSPDAWSQADPTYKEIDHGLKTYYWIKNTDVSSLMKHLSPEDLKVDIHLQVTHTIPCIWVLNFTAFTAGTAN